MKTCKRCGKKDLGWNRKWQEYSGRWQLDNHKNKDGEWCISNIIKPKLIKITKKDFTICPLCYDTNFGYCRNEDYEKHEKMFHPNGEVLTNKDFQST